MLPWVVLVFMSTGLSPCLCVRFNVLSNCHKPQGDNFLSEQGQQTGIALEVTSAEFYTAFANTLRLSDGSQISVQNQGRMESLRYMQVNINKRHVE